MRRWMAAGLLASLSGTFVVAGVIPGAVAAGVLPIVWLPVIQSIETIEDMSSPVVARLLRDRDPGRVLVACEAFDVVACALALALIWTTPLRPAVVFVAYVLIVSVVPLFVDVAEELFTGEIARISHGAAVRFNITVYAMLGVSGSLMARPLGSLLAAAALPAALGVNLCCSLAGLLLRRRSVRTLAAIAVNPPEAAPESRSVRASLSDIVRAVGPGSPVVSGLLACSASIVAGYLAQWAAQAMPRPSAALTALLVASGVGATVGPYLARGVPLRVLLVARIAALGAVCGLALTGGLGGGLRFAGMLVLTVCFAAAVQGAAVLQATARQARYRGHLLAQMVGWSHSLAAAGTFVGVWCGLALGVQRAPVAGVLAAVAVTLAAMTRLSPRRR
ncbi:MULTISPECIES: MFS transporter [unclassified Actinoplanes]|uniref:MFS transporter n=1 Tax=unclassified Actinoplanes TaxID=2626549 RepID=UPI0012BAA7B0|nr:MULTISPECIES: MFS transporter [unclassified Actinoplanes]